MHGPEHALVFPAAAKVYEETMIIIKRLTALQKRVADEIPEAYDEVGLLLDRMTGMKLSLKP